MKKATLILSILTFLFTVSVSAQKIKIKKGNVTVDGVLMFKTDAGTFSQEKSIYDLNDNELVFIQWDSFIDTATGEEVKYNIISFPDLDLKMEVSINTFKSILKKFIKNNLFENGTLVEEKVERFVKKYGSEFSKRRKELSDGKVIIINEIPAQKNGININIGN